MKRLFIFAAFDPRILNAIDQFDPSANTIQESTIIYIRELSKIGDVVFFISNFVSQQELDKVKPYTLYAGGTQHGEYDFGSYKRAYIWAADHLNMSEYDWVYMVNDSMYAPLHPIQPILTDLESRDVDATGMVAKAHNKNPHIQSWWIGMRPQVFLSQQFDAFMRAVTKQSDKGMVTWLYETGFTKMLVANNWTWTAAWTVRGHGVYNNIKSLFRDGFPFMKKVSFIRKNGALGRQISYILKHIDPKLCNAIIQTASHEYGTARVNSVLTNNPFKIIWRNIKHSMRKLFIEGI